VSPERPLLLLVEDDLPLRQLYKLELEVRGYTVQVAADGDAALEMLASGRRPALVILDLGLPRVSGLNVAEEINAHSATSTIPIVVVTASAEDIDEQRFARLLRKPVAPEVLSDVVDQCLRAARIGTAREWENGFTH
jgi:putative two-component system response regulator